MGYWCNVPWKDCIESGFSTLHLHYSFTKYLYLYSHPKQLESCQSWWYLCSMVQSCKAMLCDLNWHSCSLSQVRLVTWKLEPCQVVRALFRMKTHCTGWVLHTFIEGDKARELGPFWREDWRRIRKKTFKGAVYCSVRSCVGEDFWNYFLMQSDLLTEFEK